MFYIKLAAVLNLSYRIRADVDVPSSFYFLLFFRSSNVRCITCDKEIAWNFFLFPHIRSLSCYISNEGNF